MTRRANLINNVIYLLLTMGALFFAVYVCNSRYTAQFFSVGLKFAVGALIASFVATVFHEVGHVIAGKKAGFKFSETVIWFLKWSRNAKSKKFSFTAPGNEAGYTQMIPTSADNLDKKLKKMTSGALIASFTVILIGIIPFFIKELSIWQYCLLASFLPVGTYSFFGNALPMLNEGFMNDGAVIKGIKKKDDSITVALALLEAQAQMYNGKTPSEVDERLLFDLPQLPEDDPNFIMLLLARYDYYLDKGDYEMAKSVTERLMMIVDDIPSAFAFKIKLNALYNACTFDFNEELADDLMYELEKQLNKSNSAENVRVKLAYILNVKKETAPLEVFYKKGVKEANRCQIKGFSAFEKKLLEGLKENA